MNTEGIIVGILNGLNPRCANSNFAAIARIHSRPRVEAGLSGREPFDSPTALAYLAVARKMMNLSDTVGLPLDWSECDKIRAALDSIDDGSLRISIYKGDAVVHEKVEAWVVQFKSGSFFLRARQNYADKLEILSVMNVGQAANFSGRELAESALKTLESLGRAGQVILNKYPVEDDVLFELEMAGLTAARP